VWAVACAKTARVIAKPGPGEPLNLYVLVLLLPGERKSAVMGDLVAPIETFEAAARKAARELLRKTLKAGTGGPFTAGDEPKVARYLVDDATMESVTTLLAENNGRLGLISPEAHLFALAAGHYSKNAQPNLNMLLKAHSGDTLRVDRKSRDSEFVDAPALTVGIAAQPVILDSIRRDDFRGRGLTARFLYSLPQSRLGERDVRAPGIPPEIKEAYHRQLTALMSLKLPAEDPDSMAARELRLDDAATDAYYRLAQEIEDQLRPGGDLGGIRDWGGKLLGAVVRIAGLLHMTDHASAAEPWTNKISGEVMERAISIGQYLTAHAKAALGKLTTDPMLRRAEAVLTWVEGSELPTFTARDVFEGTKGSLHNMETLNPILDLLVEHGYLREVTAPRRTGPGRPGSRRFELTPNAASHNPQNAFDGVSRSPAPTNP